MPGAGGRGDFFIDGEEVASGRIDRTIPFFIGTEPADVGMDDLTPVTSDYPAYDNEFTGTIHEIVVGVGPMGEAFDPPLEMARPRRRPAPRRRRSAAGCPAVHSRD